ncbi:hypothetical protein INS49_003767 [Diaporthe citri]|uniref:uncharacterized protein n=1 Tax=Diaporthe citri TaxID=83186 RepID=UPI001C8211D0|nr:uncharacterized protein INS49_003767 [Diaporthe citri]KAG6355801.1 hypothetical protein INS49_003767 [Diaporthe citri]
MSYLSGASTQDVSREIQTVQEDIQNLSCAGDGDDQAQRQALLSSARELVNALETTGHVVARMSWDEPTMSGSLRILIDLGIFKHMLEGDTTVPKQANELAELSGADPVLLQRLLKRVASSSPPATEFMKKTNYRNPISKDDTIWKFGAGIDIPYFTWLQSQDDRLLAFANHMKFKSVRQNWYDTVTLNEIFPADFDPQAVLMVDVGGNAGHDLLGFHRAHPKQPGRLILQDLPNQLQPLDKQALAPVEPMAHDFFTPQPVKGAKAYYLKMVLHDWPDAQCREILNNLKPALTPGYSKILLNEIVVLDQGADWFSTSVDLLMMVFHSSWERREKQWRELTESVGLKVTRIWPCGGAPEKLIEVELA